MLSASIRHEGLFQVCGRQPLGELRSATAGWRISNGREFMKDFDWLDDLKIRFPVTV